MEVSEIMKKMIEYSEGNIHDINHLIKVHSYASTIGRLEGLTDNKQYILEVAAILHDIACPLCREKYGNTNGKYQEEEGYPLTKEFLADTDLSKELIERIAFLVGHHHSPDQIDDVDYQILIEADYLVNADESNYSIDNIQNFRDKFFKTKYGTEILNSIYMR